jgi:large conductance mechanosensitive channel
MIREFRDFVLRGNVLDLAVGIVIGAAFTAIINSLVADILTPLIGILFRPISRAWQ